MFESVQIKLVAYLVGAALLAFAAWRTSMYFEDVGYQRAVVAYETKLSEAKKESLERERALQSKVDEAEKKGAEREKIHRVERAVLESRVIGLRDDLATFRARLPKVSGAACVEAADTVAELFGECTDRYSKLAEAADGHANDALTCQEAWPK